MSASTRTREVAFEHELVLLRSVRDRLVAAAERKLDEALDASEQAPGHADRAFCQADRVLNALREAVRLVDRRTRSEFERRQADTRTRSGSKG